MAPGRRPPRRSELPSYPSAALRIARVPLAPFIPAQAGLQFLLSCRKVCIPASAGMSGVCGPLEH